MSLKPTDPRGIPEETVRVAKAAFSKGNPYMKLRDELSVLYSDEGFCLGCLELINTAS
jgi:transposase